MKIFDDIRWRNKRLVCTWHFYQEWARLGKPLEFVVGILEHGTHALESKRQSKYRCTYPWHGRLLCLVYIECDEYILIHIKSRSR